METLKLPLVPVLLCFRWGRYKLYTELTTITRSLPSHNIVLVSSDMNARIDQRDPIASVYNGTAKENRQRLREHTFQDFKLQAINTRYIKLKGYLWTQKLSCGMEEHIDYILIDAKWNNSVLNCEVYNTFFTVGFEHIILTAKLKLSLMETKSSTSKKFRHNWSKLLLIATPNDFLQRKTSTDSKHFRTQKRMGTAQMQSTTI